MRTLMADICAHTCALGNEMQPIIVAEHNVLWQHGRHRVDLYSFAVRGLLIYGLFWKLFRLVSTFILTQFIRYWNIDFNKNFLLNQRLIDHVLGWLYDVHDLLTCSFICVRLQVSEAFLVLFGFYENICMKRMHLVLQVCTVRFCVCTCAHNCHAYECSVEKKSNSFITWSKSLCGKIFLMSVIVDFFELKMFSYE